MKGNRVDPVTERLLDEAGIGVGMKVLELGCGNGDVTRMIAERVGPSGQVYGVDRNEKALADAQQQTTDAGFRNVKFSHCDLNDPNTLPTRLVNAVVARRVLMYLRDRTAVLRRVTSLLELQGVVAFQEHSRTMTPGRAGEWPIHDLWHQRVWETVQWEGADPETGIRLPAELADLGFQIVHVGVTGVVAGFEQGRHSFIEIVQMMVPRMEAAGLLQQGQIDIEQLAEQLNKERQTNQSIYVSDLAFSVAGRLAE